VDPIMHRSMGHEGRVPPRDRSAAARPPNGEHARRRGELRQCRHGRHPLILSLRSSGCTSADRSVRSVTAQRVRERERERVKELGFRWPAPILFTENVARPSDRDRRPRSSGLVQRPRREGHFLAQA
jgi:hypothetical protein